MPIVYQRSGTISYCRTDNYSSLSLSLSFSLSLSLSLSLILIQRTILMSMNPIKEPLHL